MAGMIEGLSSIDLSVSQAGLLDAQPQPPVVRDPRTGQEYFLIRREIYEQLRALVEPLNRNWDNPADDDLIRNDA
jgi:hypothetical protein